MFVAESDRKFYTFVKQDVKLLGRRLYSLRAGSPLSQARDRRGAKKMDFLASLAALPLDFARLCPKLNLLAGKEHAKLIFLIFVSFICNNLAGYKRFKESEVRRQVCFTSLLRTPYESQNRNFNFCYESF